MATRAEDFAIPIRRGRSAPLPEKQDRDTQPAEDGDMTKATEERILHVLERMDERMDRPVAVAPSPASMMDRLWAAAPVVLVCATMLVSVNGRFLGGESNLDKRVSMLEKEDTRREKVETQRERDIKLLDLYAHQMREFIVARGFKSVPDVPQLGKEIVQ